MMRLRISKILSDLVILRIVKLEYIDQQIHSIESKSQRYMPDILIFTALII